ncbi:hypothetical protein KC343_g8580 [Hortaea werneckii]|uniref:Uncharacterized protein n=1 Tax=Hortaea werneckii TaxID=91943 RepID=A0A3M7EXI5_HORWE|nr:hypothetical protein KC343_g8580 [Hortaea werneckii]KAI7644117.1 hypothetical protein KC319_g12401 [Hortaea werneckii]RMY81157.1 hypothetical protein D0864_08389 [Hortaea werneckii]
MKSTLALAFAALAAAAPSISTRETGNELVWTGDIQDGGPNRTFTGKIESIYFQVLEANPDFVPNSIPEIEVPDTSKLQKRVDVDCNIFSDIPAYADGIVDQINYLYRLGGNCGITPGCTRVSCSYDNSVYACSRTGGDTAPECARLADGASAILGRCTRGGKVWGNDAESTYFVDVHSDDC